MPRQHTGLKVIICTFAHMFFLYKSIELTLPLTEEVHLLLKFRFRLFDFRVSA
jgi:hypothetical protein